MTTSLSALIAACAAAAGMSLLWRPRGQILPATVSSLPVADDRGLLFRLRFVLAGLAFIGVWAFVGGMVGLVAGAGAAFASHRGLVTAEPPAVRRHREELTRDLPTGVQLLSATVAAGGAVEQGLELVADAFPGALAVEFRRLHHRFALGADPVTVWRDLGRDDQLAPLGRAMVRSHESGAPVARSIAALGQELSDKARFDVEARAKSVDVKSAGPLGLCLLPAFVLIGVVPVVVSIFSVTGLFE